MTDEFKLKALSIVLILVGLTFLVGLWPLTQLWPSGWSWHAEGRSYYLEMIISIYAVLGIFLLIASRDPLAHRSLISFTIWSSVAHGGVMAFQSFDGDHNMGHLLGDVPALFIVAITLAILMPAKSS